MAGEQIPDGLGDAGATLWRDVMATYSLDPAEVALLGATARTLDELERVETALADAPMVVAGSMGQVKAHPLLAQVRAHRKIVESLVRTLALPLPGEATGHIRTPQARASANARWGRQRRLRVVGEVSDGSA